MTKLRVFIERGRRIFHGGKLALTAMLVMSGFAIQVQAEPDPALEYLYLMAQQGQSTEIPPLDRPENPPPPNLPPQPIDRRGGGAASGNPTAPPPPPPQPSAPPPPRLSR